MSSDFEIEEKPAKSRKTTTATEASEAIADKSAQKPEDKADVAKKPEFDPAELIMIFDTILFEGMYKETRKIRGKLEVAFRSRTTKEAWEITQKVDKGDFNTYQALEQFRQMQFLAYSLAQYGNRKLDSLELAKRQEFIEGLPVQVMAALIDELAKFDAKISAACKEAEENF